MGDTNIVEVQTLKEQGFTDEDIKAVDPNATLSAEPDKTPAAEPAAEPPKEPPTDPAPVDDPQPDSEMDGKKHPNVVSYDRFKEVNERAKQLAAELAAYKANPAPVPQQPQQQPSPQPAPQNPNEAKAKYYAMLNRDADREAREIHGIAKDEDISTLQFTNTEKYQEYLTTKTALVQDKDLENRRVWQIEKGNAEFIQYLQSDPLFPQISKFAQEDLNRRPKAESLEIDAAANRVLAKRGTREDFNLIAKTLAEYKQKMLAGNGAAPPQNTPQTSPLEKAAGLPRANNLSGAKTSAMSWQQVEQLINAGKFDEIPKDMLKQIDPKLVE